MKKTIIVLILMCITVTSCTFGTEQKTEEATGNTPEVIEVPVENVTDEEPALTEEEIRKQTLAQLREKIDLSLKPNEMGKVMVLMYHSIGDNSGAWEITPEQFRNDLEYLYENKYRPISLKNYVDGIIDIPEGCTPVVITFDDANLNTYNIIVDNEGNRTIEKDCAVAIMEEFNEKYEDFNVTATFFVFGVNPFRQPELAEYKINFLLKNGYDIGNHTYNHANLDNLNAEMLQYEIGREVEFLKSIIKDYDYEIDTFSLPFGSNPPEEYEEYLIKGQYKDTRYENKAILEVGWYPAHSVFDRRFDFTLIPRIRASATADSAESEEWFAFFENNPKERFISDGVKEIITLPEKLKDNLVQGKYGNEEVFIYQEL